MAADTDKPLKIALVGCGQIADAHLQEVRKIAGAEAVAVCDRHVDLAEQAAARFGVPQVFADLDEMLATARPDVLHVATPPGTHAPIALRALRAGLHVYVEKPFTLNAAEADQVLEAARAAGRLVTVGHDHLFDPAWEECRRMHQAGRLGRVVHVEAVQGYNLGGPFGKTFASEPDHWVHRLPGGLFQNVISHPLYRITDFLPDERPLVWANWWGGASGGGHPTELRAVLRGADVTANLVFSTTLCPVQRVARVYGTSGSVEVDLDGQLLRAIRAPGAPGAFGKLEAPFRQMKEAGARLGRNLWRFARSEIHYFAGMNKLFTLFYDAIRRGAEPPIPYGEIRRVTAIMDEIFRCCRDTQATTGAPGAAGAPAAPAARADRADGADNGERHRQPHPAAHPGGRGAEAPATEAPAATAGAPAATAAPATI